MNDETKEIFEELAYYIPDVQINGPHGLKWMLGEDILDEPYLRDLLQVRRVQFLEGRIGPDMEVPEFQGEER